MSTQLVLERDGHDQAWGFRLQGGTDVGLPLSIQRVLVGTPSEAVLKRGDVITKIGTVGTNGLTHQQAADLFGIAGNRIEITVKRASSGAPQLPSTAQPSVSTLQASAAHRQQQQQKQQQELPQSPQVAALPRTSFFPKKVQPPQPKAASSKGLSVKNQPYRTLPLVHPSIKVKKDFGAGATNHLKIQEDLCAGIQPPQIVPLSPVKTNQIKNFQLLMKKKTQQGLVNAASEKSFPPPTTGPITGPVPVKLPPSPSLPQSYSPQPAKYNSAAGLYANQSSGYLKKPAGTGMVNPGQSGSLLRSINRPTNKLPFFALAKKYDPEQSATWQAIHEQENCQLVTEHGPTESKVYSI